MSVGLPTVQDVATDRAGDAQGRPAWPLYLQELCSQGLQSSDTATREWTRGEIWRVLNSALIEFLEFHAARVPAVLGEDLESLASQKALDLLQRIVLGKWDIADRSPQRVRAFLRAVAKNAVLNLSSRARRRVLPQGENLPEWDVGETGEGRTMGTTGAPDERVARREYVLALKECVGQLKPRWRKAWFLRVLCNMSTKEIASHPEIGLTIGHVDVLLQRSRQAMRQCMQKRGHAPHEMPPGTFTALWQACEAEMTSGAEVRDG